MSSWCISQGRGLGVPNVTDFYRTLQTPISKSCYIQKKETVLFRELLFSQGRGSVRHCSYSSVWFPLRIFRWNGLLLSLHHRYDLILPLRPISFLRLESLSSRSKTSPLYYLGSYQTKIRSPFLLISSLRLHVSHFNFLRSDNTGLEKLLYPTRFLHSYILLTISKSCWTISYFVPHILPIYCIVIVDKEWLVVISQ